MFTVIPAIDLKDGHCVRLKQGRADQSKVYSDDPVAVALKWQEEGAKRLHVVDLDGAFSGRPVHTAVVRRIVEAVSIPVQLGGGLRTESDVKTALDSGVAAAIIGTSAIYSKGMLVSELVKRFGSRVAVAIDARDGIVKIKGWVEDSGLKATDLARQASEAGVETIICTDIATDGMLRGPNLKSMAEMCRAADCNVIASGGVGKPDDVRALIELGFDNLKGVIVGKALYDGSVSLPELIASAGKAK